MTIKIEEIFLSAESDNESSDFIPLITDGEDTFVFQDGENEDISI